MHQMRLQRLPPVCGGDCRRQRRHQPVPAGRRAGHRAPGRLAGQKVIPLNPVNGLERPRSVAYIDESLCIGCTLCIQACPVDAIVGAAKQMHTVVTDLCTGCDLCVAPCPVDCIVMYPVSGDATGWDAWSQAEADDARARHDFRTQRLRRETEENEARLAAKAVAKMHEVTQEVPVTPDEQAEKERKRAIIAAAMERARAKAAAASTDTAQPATITPKRRMNAAKRLEIFTRFRAANPSPKTELDYTTPFELLIAVLLSAQATDVSVNKATRLLYPVANTPATILALGVDELASYIRTIGLFRTKAKNVIATCQILLEQHGGEVPRDRASLEALPGVGRKTANVVMNTAFGEPTMAVDTHIFRVSNRTGIAPGKNVDIVEQKLLKFIPKEFLHDAHHWLILHGRYTCTARKPQCWNCMIADLCDYKDKSPMPAVV